MNTANLQLEGVYAALSALIMMLRERGVLNEEEIERALRGAEYRLAQDSGHPDLSEANLNAILFPIRLLRLANRAEDGSEPRSFADLAAEIGRMRDVDREG